MALPPNAEALRQAGYSFLGHSECCACYGMVEWWRTPQGRTIDLNPMPTAATPARGHWTTCGVTAKQRAKKAPGGVATPTSQDRSLGTPKEEDLRA